LTAVHKEIRFNYIRSGWFFNTQASLTIDIKSLLCHHNIEMRTTIDVDSDVLEAAKSLAQARQTSIGKALSQLARRGVTVLSPLSARNGFCVFQVSDGTPSFGPDEIQAALDAEDRQASREFVKPDKA
jgi:hypothetical protein